MKYSYYPGCTLRNKAKDLDEYARASARALGFELEEIEDWQCCGGVYPLGTDEIATKLSSVRALNQAKEKGQDLVTICSACHHVIKRVNDDMKNVEDIRTRANNYMQLDEPYEGETTVLHYLEVLRDKVGFDKLKEKVVNPLTGKKIGAYYGCLLLRPGKIMAFDDPENPTIMEDFIRALGAEPVIYPYRNECCGGYISLKEKDMSQNMCQKIEDSAKGFGADMLITHHPMIFKAMKKINDEDFIGRRVLKLIRDDISYYAMHTNYDVMGMAELAGKVLELSEPEVLEVTGSMHSESGEVPVGIGRVADLAQPMDLKSCAEMVKKAFDLPNVKIFGEPDMQVHRLGVFPGSGKSAISVSLEKGVDVLVTGDIDHHEGIDAVAQKMAVIDAGHYGVEHIFIADMEHFCREKFPEAEIRTAKIRQPFWVLT